MSQLLVLKSIILAAGGMGCGVRMAWGREPRRFVGRMVEELAGRRRGRLLTQLQQDGDDKVEGADGLSLRVTAHTPGLLAPLLLQDRLQPTRL